MKAPAAVFLDRDGLIIEDVRYIRDPADVRLLPGAAEGIAEINRRGIPAIVVTNQSGIARGLLTVADYEAVRERLGTLLAEKGAHIDASYYCPHHPSVTGPCDCRKPGIQLFVQAMQDFKIAEDRAAYIGDRWRDVAAAQTLGGRAILVPTGARKEISARRKQAGIEEAATLQEAVEMLFNLTEGPDKK